MQINKLIINAFLFCKGREEIDFSSIDEKILKNIDKDTKKVKNFFFDCICYSLFGRFHSDNINLNDLRSHEAEATDEAFVEVEFSNKGKNYRIYRKPAQIRERKRVKDSADKFMKVSAKSVLEFLSEDRLPVKRKVEIEKELCLNILKLTFEEFVSKSQKEFYWLSDSEEIEMLEKEKRKKELALKQLRESLPEITRGKKLASLCYSIINNNIKVLDKNVDSCYKAYCQKLTINRRAEEEYKNIKEKLDKAGIKPAPKKKDNNGFWESVIEIGKLFSAGEESSEENKTSEENALSEEEVKELQNQLSEASLKNDDTAKEKKEALLALKSEVENFQQEVNSLTGLFNSYYELFKEILTEKGYPLQFELPAIKMDDTDEKIGYVLGYDVRIIHETMLKLMAVQSKVAGIGNRLSKQYHEAMKADVRTI